MKKPFQLWIDALLSGKYKQIAGKLKNDEGHCCLGVLCEVYNLHITEKLNERYDLGKITYFDGEPNYPPEKVLSWLKDKSPKKSVDLRIFCNELVIKNDSGTPFDQIALRIDEYFGGI